MDTPQPLEQTFRHAVELHRAGHNDQAGALLRAVLGRAPDHHGALYRLGVIAHQAGRLDEAREHLVRASSLELRQPVYPYTLGMVLHDLGDHDGAAAAYREAVRRHPVFAEAWNNLGLVELDARRFDTATAALREALRLRPDYPAAQRNLASALAAHGRELETRNHCEAAIACYGEAAALEPQDLRTARSAALCLPVVYASADELATARRRYAAGLDGLIAALPRFLATGREPGFAALRNSNFYLAYQGGDDLDLQSRYGDFLDTLLRQTAPQWMQPRPPVEVTGRRIRIGFVSSFFRHCTAGLYFKSWITDLDRTRFEIHVYHLSPRHDFLTEIIRTAADHFSDAEALDDEAVAAQIADASLDVLVYPELGMHDRTFLLAAMRLAPVQCAGWGHPVTSGLPNVDVFLSAAAMEPEGAQAHYRERLVLLPGIGTCYPRPIPPAPGSRSALGLPEGRRLYLFPQSPFKIHPDNDALLARVLDQDPESTLVLFEGQNAETTAALLARWTGRAGIDRRRLLVLPTTGHDDYLRINACCDLMLDCLRWSGGNTSLDALACGLPVVTLPGACMRSRQSAGMLRLIGVEELIAADADDYLRIAARLGRDRAWRDAIGARIRAGLDKLFDRTEPVAALQAFLIQATGRRET